MARAVVERRARMRVVYEYMVGVIGRIFLELVRTFVISFNFFGWRVCDRQDGLIGTLRIKKEEVEWGVLSFLNGFGGFVCCMFVR